MKFKKGFLIIFFMLSIEYAHPQNDTSSALISNATSYFVDDTLILQSNSFSLLDSFKNEKILQTFFNKTYSLPGLSNTILLSNQAIERNLPFLKQIKPAIVYNNSWKAFYIIGILIFIALIRLLNPRNFESATSIMFDILFISSIKNFNDTKFTWVTFHLFIVYILSFSLILTQFFEYNQLFNNIEYYNLVWIVSLIIFIIYLIKFIIYFIVGYLLNDLNSSTKMVVNIIQISNFLGFVLILFAMFYIYVNALQLTQTIFFAMVGIFFTAILYRIFRYLTNQISNSTLPFFYLFIYLCALEISPWLIFIKILNSYLS
jgi:hypothetical protein